MAHPSQIGPGIFMVAGPDLTDPRDALAYLIQDGKELALIDAGAGPSYSAIIDQIRLAGQAPDRLRMIIVTHAHIDHIGALADFARDYSVSIVAHAEDCQALEAADPVFTAAKSYGLDLKPVEVTVKLEGRINRLALGQTDLTCLHTPGHTPGSMVVYLDRDSQRYLFGQDIHGPFNPAFGSDLKAWRASMKTLLDLKADVLCEGHYGVFYGTDKIAEFIYEFLDQYSD